MEAERRHSEDQTVILWTGFWTVVSRIIQIGVGLAILYGVVAFVKWAWIHS